MKEKILFILVLFLGVSSVSRGQDFKPSEDAQGYEASKNLTVDYSTGLLHYKIPLVELTSGDFSLPVSLNFQSQKSQVGLWTLQFGGVISRVMRGGVPDEKRVSGYIHGCSANGGVPLKIKEVNMHRQDGECDIFTISFGGGNINFYIRKGNSGIEVVPMERTNVRIVCEANSEADSIMGWNATDEYGVKYIYRQQEIVREIQRKEAVGINNLEEDRYVSAWYLTRIEIPGKRAIDFYYNGYSVRRNIEERLVRYYYGEPMFEYEFDFKRHRVLLTRRMNEVLNALEDARRYETFVQGCLRSLDGIGSEWDNMVAMMNSFNRESMLCNFMGTLSEFGKVPLNEATITRIIHDVNVMMEDSYVEFSGVYNALSALKGCIVDMFQPTPFTRFADRLTSLHRIEVPTLERIVTPDKELIFEYTTKKLTGVMLHDYKGDLIQKIVLSNNKQGEMREVSWHDQDGEKVKNQLFRYGKAGGKWSVLTRVILDTKGSINMEYEDNTCSGKDTVEGYRLKSLVIKDENGNTDSVKYRYPYPGNVIYESISRREKVKYNGFEDEVFSETPFYKGARYVNTGNNGVYYHYVEEEFVGKGTTTYLYSVPDKFNEGFPFWVCGIPLAKGTYDVDGNLVSCEKRRYLTDLSVTKFQAGGETFFEDAPEQVKYKQRLEQVQPCPYYIDKDSSLAQYQKQPVILLYKDKGQEIYLDPSWLWRANIQPRADYVDPEYRYSFIYGGKTLLKEREEYQFNGRVSSSPSIEHLTGDLPNGGRLVSREEYMYDNLDVHVSPTRVIRKLANGDERVLSRRTPLDFLPGTESWIDQMREENVVAPLIKEQSFLKKKGSDMFKLLDENAIIYGKRVATSGGVVFVPEKMYEYVGGEREQVSWPVLEEMVLTFPEEKYRETVMTYSLFNEEFLPVETLAPGERVACCYDQARNNLILKVDGVAKVNTDAVDRYRVLEDASGRINLREFLEVTPVDGENRFRVFFWCMPTSSSLNVAYSVKHKGGEVNLTSGSQKVITGKWQLLFFDVDVAAYSEVSSVKVFLPAAGKVALGVMVPADAVFEAVSTDSFGREFCTFNQQGHVVRNEYDRANRLHRRYDGAGNVLEIYRYENIH
ncbi:MULTISPECIES: hypothetical protein [unclassified Butyricimonas]|uniref:hypothetical protein n=1 Tax=unclassified Butyricimonas TaxID=2637652 RepID=UPI000C08091F|nr:MULTISPECIES: hypothetical protein [unclassified Butyricimonas]